MILQKENMFVIETIESVIYVKYNHKLGHIFIMASAFCDIVRKPLTSNFGSVLIQGSRLVSH